MSNIALHLAAHIEDKCSSYPCSSNLTKTRFTVEQPNSSQSSSDSSCNSQLNNKKHLEANKDLISQTISNGMQQYPIIKENIGTQQNIKDYSMCSNKNLNISEFNKGECLNVQNSSCDSNPNVITNMTKNEIEDFKKKCYQSLNDFKINGKRKQLGDNQKYLEDKIVKMEKEKNENQNSSNKLKVEDSKCPRKILKTNYDTQKYTLQIEEKFDQISSCKSKQENSCRNKFCRWPHSVSSFGSFSSNDKEELESDQEESDVEKNEKLINDDADEKEESDDVNNLIAKKMKQQNKQEEQTSNNLQNNNENLGRAYQIFQRYLNASKEKLNPEFIQLNAPEEKTSQLSSDHESMECSEESISDLVQSSKNNDQLTKKAMQLEQEQSISDDDLESESSQSEGEAVNEGELYISDTEEDSHLIKFDSTLYENDYILILDLDNTLVHSYMGVPSLLARGDPTVNSIETHVNSQRLYIKRRPFLKEFFDVAFKNFKVVMYTLGSLGYAKAVYQLFKKEYPEVFSQNKFLRIIAQNTQRNTQNPAQASGISSPQLTIQKTVTIIPKDQTQSTNSQQQQNQNNQPQNPPPVEQNSSQQPLQTQNQNQQYVQMTKFLKNISKYFPPEKFSKRLLIFDDNSRVYEQFWQKNAIFTKPYHFWLSNNNAISTSSDSFLFFAAELLKQILKQIQGEPDLSQIYQKLRRSILENERFYITKDNPERPNLIELIKELGGEVYDNVSSEDNNKQLSMNFPETGQQQMNNTQELSLHNSNCVYQNIISQISQLPNYLILNECQQNDPVLKQTALENGIEIISSDWIKYCYLLNFKVPNSVFNFQYYQLYQQSKSFPTLENDFVSLYCLNQTQQQI